MIGVIVFTLLGTLATAFFMALYIAARLGLTEAWALPGAIAVWLMWAATLTWIGRSWLWL
ncbi:MAG: hypothetical protein V3S12_01285 [Acidiferrobacterales bacterium]